MKLLFFASDYQIGLTSLLTEKLKFLVRQPGLEVMAIAGETEQTKGLTQQIEDHLIPITRVNGLDVHRNFFKLAKQLSLIIKNAKCPFVHVQNNWQLTLIVFIKFFYKVDYKIIYTIHGYRHNNYFKAIIAKRIIDLALFFFTDIVFASSSEVKQKFWLIRKKCNILYLGVEESYFNIPKPDYYVTQKHIIFAGQFRKGKNQKMIVEAVAKYIGRTGNKDFSVYLPGEGPLKEKCNEYADLLNLQETIIFPGQLCREEILKLYSCCQVAIVPTNSETFGHCIAEPFVMGLSVLTRNVGIANDIIIDGENGLIFNNANDLSLLLEKYLTNGESLAALGKSAWSKRELFRWSSICVQYRNIIEDNHNKKLTQTVNREEKTDILYFASDYMIGLSFSLSEQARSISELSSVNLLCIAGDTEQEFGLTSKYERLDIPLIRIKDLDKHKRFFHLAKKLNKIISENKTDVIHTHNNWQLALSVFVKYFYGNKFKIIYSIHGYRHNHTVRAFFAKKIIGFALFLFADLVLAGSTELKKAIPFIRKKCRLMMQGVEEDLFKNKEQVKFNGHKNIIFAGQFRKGKNQKDLLLALHAYTKQTGNDNYTLYLPGKGALQRSCINFANKLKLTNNVVFPGQLTRNQIIQLYEKCQVAIIPTNFETFGYCIAEPYVAGLCVISRKTGIALDIIEHEKSGLLFDNVDDLTELLVKYLCDENQLEIMSQNAIANREVLRWRNITQNYEMLINEIIN